MKTIGHILAKYTAWILHLLTPLGMWGVFAIAFADSALLGMPVDAIVALYVYQNHGRLLLYVLMAALGSVIGSIPLYIVGYLGGEKVLRKRISEERFLRIHRSFEEHEFWALDVSSDDAAADAVQNFRAGRGGVRDALPRFCRCHVRRTGACASSCSHC